MAPENRLFATLAARLRDASDRTAWREESGRALTGAALLAHLDALAAGLADRADPRSPLGLVLAPRSALARHLLAALRAGFRVLPLHPLPRPQLARLFAHAGIRQAVTDDRARLPDGVRPLAPPPAAAGRRLPPGTLGGAELWLATSGTGGMPRIVRHTPETLLASVAATRQALELSNRDHWLCCLPVDHAGGLMVALRALVTGGQVCFLSGFDAAQVLETLERDAITHVSLVPAQLHRLLETHPGPAPSTLRCLLVGGGPLSGPLAHKARQAGWPLYVTWGMTETASHLTLCRVTEGWQPGRVGKPVPGVELKLADPDTHGSGRIEVCAPQVMRGYLGEAELPSCASGRRFATGDLGRWTRAGELEWLGRADDLLGTGGHLVAPETIETAIQACPGVREAAVTGIGDPVWGTRLVLLYLGEASPRALEDWCRAHLPSWQRPRLIFRVEALPRTRTGKIDRAALRRWAQESAAGTPA